VADPLLPPDDVHGSRHRNTLGRKQVPAWYLDALIGWLPAKLICSTREKHPSRENQRRSQVCRARALIEKVRFAVDSLVEGNGFELSVPRCLATANSVGPSCGGEGWLLETPQQFYRFAEADDSSDDAAAPTVDRLQLGRSLETAAYLARNWKFESIPLQ
jgi:hypothetical protein